MPAPPRVLYVLEVQRCALPLSLVKFWCGPDSPHEVESVNDIRQPIRGKRQRCGHHMEVQVGCRGVPGVADTGEDLPPLNPVPDLYPDAARLEMRVQGKPSIAQIEDDMVAICLLKRDAGGQRA